MKKSRLSLKRLRKLVDVIDRKIIGLLIQRFRTTKQIQNLKIENGIPIEQKGREILLIKRYQGIAANHNIHPSLLKKLYGLIFSYAKKAGIIKRYKKASWKLKLKKKRNQ